MRHLVRKYGSELGFIRGCLNRSEIDEDGAAGKRKRVDVGDIHNVEVVGPVISGRLCSEFLPEILNVPGDWTRVWQNRHLLINLINDFLSQRDLLLGSHVVFAGFQFDACMGARTAEQKAEQKQKRCGATLVADVQAFHNLVRITETSRGLAGRQLLCDAVNSDGAGGSALCVLRQPGVDGIFRSLQRFLERQISRV